MPEVPTSRDRRSQARAGGGSALFIPPPAVRIQGAFRTTPRRLRQARRKAL